MNTQRRLLYFAIASVELFVRVSHYNGQHLFGYLILCMVTGSSGIMRWNGDWMAFLDSMMQCRVITKEDNYPCLLGGIRSVRIDPIKHFQSVIDLPDGTQGIN